MKTRDFLLCICSLLTMAGCEKNTEKEEKLARTYCASCHQFPEPMLLDKKTWESNVLPEMAFRMGLDYSKMSGISKADYPFVVPSLPDSPIITQEEWEAIKKYYLREAPDSLVQSTVSATTDLVQFEAIPISLEQNRIPLISLLKVDSATKSIYTSNRQSWLHQFDYQFKLMDSVSLSSPASSIFNLGHERIITQLGLMDPNDQPKGSVASLSPNNEQKILIDSLKRPVYTKAADLNDDGLTDLVVCAFGNYTGELLVFENEGNSTYKRHVISPLPGARKVEIQDFNKDGLPDLLVLLTQGDEQITLYANQGNFQFLPQRLLRFPPVFGSSYFEMADVDADGYFDIIYSNGDNADFSQSLKPYHGIRLFRNDGKNAFSENFFFPLNGCSQTITRDFDHDGDLDIATIAFFPDYERTPEKSFVYLENRNGQWIPHTTPIATKGRWLLMESVDIDSDSDDDILLSALNMNMGVPRSVLQRWQAQPVSLLLLKNKLAR